MVGRRLIAAVALVLAMAMSASAAEPARCSLSDKEFVGPVKPFFTTEDAGYTAFRQFRGAEVFVPAQPGLTAEWLDRVLTFQIAVGECNFGVPKVDVEALSDGGGFSVRLSANDERGAREILRHAQEMVK